jgi:hypothetical protein
VSASRFSSRAVKTREKARGYEGKQKRLPDWRGVFAKVNLGVLAEASEAASLFEVGFEFDEALKCFEELAESRGGKHDGVAATADILGDF